MRALVVLPVLVPLGTAIVCLALRPFRAAQRAASVGGAALLLVVAAALLHRVDTAGIQVMQMGAWPAPYGISLVADLLAAIMVLLTGITGLAVAVYSLGSIDEAREAHGYHPLFHVLLMGVSMAFLTGDLFNLYVAFEVMLMASFVLLALGGERAQLEGAVKYVTLNLLSSAVFLAAVGVLYGVAGTLNMADLALAVQRGTAPGLVTTLACLFLVAFGIKAAVFPLFFWLPASYHTPPVAVSAVFAGLLTKVGVYALVRAFTLVFTGDTALTHGLILAVAVLTMVTGVLGAAAQFEFRRVLSFHIVSQIGYMVLGLGLFTPLALAGTVFYLIHHIVVKTNLFLVGGIVKRLGGTLELGQPRGPLPLAPGPRPPLPRARLLARRDPPALRVLGQARPREGGPRFRPLRGDRDRARGEPPHPLLDDEAVERGVLEGAARGKRGGDGAGARGRSSARSSPSPRSRWRWGSAPARSSTSRAGPRRSSPTPPSTSGPCSERRPGRDPRDRPPRPRLDGPHRGLVAPRGRLLARPRLAAAAPRPAPRGRGLPARAAPPAARLPALLPEGARGREPQGGGGGARARGPAAARDRGRPARPRPRRRDRPARQPDHRSRRAR